MHKACYFDLDLFLTILQGHKFYILYHERVANSNDDVVVHKPIALT